MSHHKNSPITNFDRDKSLSMLNLAPVGLFELDEQGLCVYTNQHWTTLTGLSFNESLGLGWLSVIHPEDKEIILNQWKLITAFQDEFDFMYRLKRPDGKILIIRGRSKKIKDETGKRTGYLGSFLDITEEYNAKQQLEEAHAIAKLGNWSFDLRTQKISWSDQMYQLFPEDKANGPPSYERHQSTIHPEDRAPWKEVVNKCAQDGEPYKMRFRTVFPNKTLWIEASGSGKFDDQGKVVEIFGVCQDITEKANSEIEAANREARINALFKQSRDAIMTLSPPQWTFTDCNEATLKLFGVPSVQEFIKLGPWNLSPQFQPDGFPSALRAPQMIEKAMNVGSHLFEWTHQSVQGKPIPCTVLLSRIDILGSCYLQATVRDISLQKETEKQLEQERAKSLHQAKLASLGEMAAGLAHEINNPLTIVTTQIELLDKVREDEEKFKKKKDMILMATDRITRIVRGLQKFSRDNPNHVFSSASIKKIIDDALVIIEAKAKRYNVKIEIHDSTTKNIICDHIEIEQVIINLISNAVDAIKNKSEPRWVKIECLPKDEFVVLRITDSGEGIPKEIQEKLFEPFFTTKVSGEGTGLGLSITKGILDSHKASIAILPDCAHTCFEITFTQVEK